MKKLDVAIIGAGPAGIGISAMLAELGIKIRLFLKQIKLALHLKIGLKK